MRRRILASVGKALPYLRRVAYLEGRGAEYIDTKVYPSIYTDIEITWCYVGSGSIRVFGVQDNSAYYQSSTGSSGNDLFCAKLGKVYSYVSSSLFNNSFKTLSVVGNDWYVDGVKKTSTSSTADEITKTLKVNATDAIAGITISSCVIRIKEVIVRENDDIILHLIPVLDFLERPCFYNKAHLAVPEDDPSRFFYNQGAGEFTWGELET